MTNDNRATSRPQQLEARVACLEELFIRFAQTGAIEHTLGQGFSVVSGHLCTLSDRLESIAAELAPLRRLSGPQVPFDDEQRAHLASLLAAQARPSFDKVKSLQMTDHGVRFIGDPTRAPPQHDQLPDHRSLAS